MNSTVILLFMLVIISFLFNNDSRENFVQVQSNRVINKNAPMIKLIQVSPRYEQPVQTWDRDEPVSNPQYSPNLIPNLITPSEKSKSNLPGDSAGSFEQSEKNNATNQGMKGQNMYIPVNPNSNFQSARPESGHSIKPIEIDYDPSSNVPIEKPYLTKEYPQAYSKFLEYGNPEISKQQPLIQNKQMSISNIMFKSTNTENKNEQTQFDLSNEDIAKKIIKRAAELSLESMESMESVESMESMTNTDPVSSMKKANYAVGYLNMLKDTMSDFEIQNSANIDLYEFSAELEQIQKSSTEKIQPHCKNLSADKQYLMNTIAKL
jgi:hypothetical protein